MATDFQGLRVYGAKDDKRTLETVEFLFRSPSSPSFLSRSTKWRASGRAFALRATWLSWA